MLMVMMTMRSHTTYIRPKHCVHESLRIKKMRLNSLSLKHFCQILFQSHYPKSIISMSVLIITLMAMTLMNMNVRTTILFDQLTNYDMSIILILKLGISCKLFLPCNCHQKARVHRKRHCMS